jgi:isocitrate dehydrogenase
MKPIKVTQRPKAKKELVGVDVFLDWDAESRDPNALGAKFNDLDLDGLKLHIITNRGVKVYPDGHPETFCSDHWRCRFMKEDGAAVEHEEILKLMSEVHKLGLDFIKTENMYTFDGDRGYSLAQGE